MSEQFGIVFKVEPRDIAKVVIDGVQRNEQGHIDALTMYSPASQKVFEVISEGETEDEKEAYDQIRAYSMALYELASFVVSITEEEPKPKASLEVRINEALSEYYYDSKLTEIEDSRMDAPKSSEQAN